MGEAQTRLDCPGTAYESSPDRPLPCEDQGIEELFHLITHRGHARVYPDTFGVDKSGFLWFASFPESKLTEAMDVARYTNVSL